MMSSKEMQALLYDEHFAAPPTQCPLFPKAMSPIPHQALAFDHPPLLFAELVVHPALSRQTEAWARVALEGARHKRGPPSTRLS